MFHLGAYTHVGKSWDRVDECIQTNVHGTVALLQALARSDYERMVYTSTSEVYGDIAVPFHEDAAVNPLSPYSVSKYAGERFCRMLQRGRGWPVVVVRPFNAYGPAQSPDRVIPEIIVKGLRKERLLMTQGRQTREFNYVDDLVDGFLRAAPVPGIEGEVFNLGGGDELSIRDLAQHRARPHGRPDRGRDRGPPRPPHRDLVDAQRPHPGPRAAGPAGVPLAGRRPGAHDRLVPPRAGAEFFTVLDLSAVASTLPSRSSSPPSTRRTGSRSDA